MAPGPLPEKITLAPSPMPFLSSRVSMHSLGGAGRVGVAHPQGDRARTTSRGMNDAVIRSRPAPPVRPRGGNSAYTLSKRKHIGIFLSTIHSLADLDIVEDTATYLKNIWGVVSHNIQQAKINLEVVIGHKSATFAHSVSVPSTSFVLPFEGAVVSSEFFRENGALHGALDLVHRTHGTVSGREIRAGVSGTATRVVHLASGRGGVRVSILDDATGYTVRYMHMQAGSNSHVRQGQQIIQGEIVGRVGNTGTHAPHLHLQIEDRAGVKRPPGSLYPVLNELPAQVGSRRFNTSPTQLL